MPTAVSGVLSAIALVAMIAGVLLRRHAIARYRSPSAPKGFSWNPRDWRPVWRTRDYFGEAKGFRLYWVSCLLISGGSLPVFLAYAVRL